MTEPSSPPAKRPRVERLPPEALAGSATAPNDVRQLLDGDRPCAVVFETDAAVAMLAPSQAAYGHCLVAAKGPPLSVADPTADPPDTAALVHAVAEVTGAPLIRVVRGGGGGVTAGADASAASSSSVPLYVDVVPEGGPEAPLDANSDVLLHKLRAALPPTYRCWPFVQPGPDPGALTIRLEDSRDTAALGAVLARLAAPGDVFALLGDLGAGKTCIARGFLREFFADPDLHVPSPTYLLCLTYADDRAEPSGEANRARQPATGRARIPGTVVYHMDPYRLKQEGKLAALVDFETAFQKHICLIEWPQKLGERLYNATAPARLEVEFLGTGPQAQGRRAILRATHSAVWAGRLAAWRAAGRVEEPAPTPSPPMDAEEGSAESSRPASQSLTAMTGKGLHALAGDPKTWTILGIETSCDDTGAAVVRGDGRVLSDVLASQTGIHEQFGGVKPDAAQAAHQENIEAAVEEAMRRAGVTPQMLTAVAVTVGPGLALCLEVGVKKAMAIAGEHGLPLVPVHHMEAHAMVTRLPDPTTLQPSPVQFPALILLVSGGHNMLVLSQGLGRHKIIGNTLDDSIGEAFDKTARLLGIDAIPGGPQLEKLAQAGDPTAFARQLPMPLSKAHKTSSTSCDFSYAGLKTAVRDLVRSETRRITALPEEAERTAALERLHRDVAASFQAVAVRHLAQRMERAVQWVKAMEPSVQTVVVAGGVAANQEVRRQLSAVAEAAGLQLVCPPLRLCTDNGVMVAWTGLERLRLGLYDAPPTRGAVGYTAEVRPRWPLGDRDQRSAPAPGGRYG